MARVRSSDKTLGSNIINLTDSRLISAKEEYGKRIAFYRGKKGLSQQELADTLGVKRNAVGHWESGRSLPDIVNLAPLCQALSITASQLIGDGLGRNQKEFDLLDDYRHMSPGHQHALRQMARSLREMDTPEVECPDLIAIPKVFRPLAAGIGDPTDVFEQNELMYVQANKLTKRADYIFSVNGDSMEPTFPDGCLVLVECCTTMDLPYGKVGAFSIGNETYIKTLEEDGLHSINPKYKTISFAANPNTMLIGSVLGILSAKDLASPEEIDLFMELSKN